MLGVHTIDDSANFLNQCFEFLKPVEGHTTDIQFPPDGNPTIGVGFNLKVSAIFDAVASVIAAGCTDAQKKILSTIISTASASELQDKLDAQMLAFHNQNNAIRATFIHTTAGLKNRRSRRRLRADAWHGRRTIRLRRRHEKNLG